MTDENMYPTENADWFLRHLVTMVNGGDVEIGLTLNVGGFLVSGTLVSGHKYFEDFAEEFTAQWGDSEHKDTVKESYIKAGENFKKETDDKEKPLPPNYIHLKNCRFYNTNGNPIPGNRGVFWRGRLSEVSGFILGNLSLEES